MSIKKMSRIAHWDWDFITPAVDKIKSKAKAKAETVCPKFMGSWSKWHGNW